MKWFIALFVSIVVGVTYLPAQEAYNYQQLDNSNGLSNSAINYIFQDSDNLLWLGTWDGLNMYDGLSFHVFNYSKSNDANSIGSNIIYQIVEDGKRNIWIATIEGISKYNKNSGKFYHYFYDKDKSKNLLSTGYLLAVDTDGVVYSTSKTEPYISFYDDASDSFKRCKINNNSQGNVIKMLFDKENRFWVLKEGGLLDIYIKKGDQFFADGYNSEIAGVSDFFYVNDEVFYTSPDKRLYKTNRKQEKVPVLELPKTIRSMAFYKGHYFFAWSSTGIGEYDKNFKQSFEVSNDKSALNNRRVTCLKAGSEHILWAGTDGNGIIGILENINPFGRVNKLPNGSSINIPIRAFSEVQDELWVGTKGNGIITIKNLGKPNASHSVIQTFYSGTDLLDNCVYAIENTGRGLVFIGSDMPGITVYNTKTKKNIYWKDISGSEKFPLFRSVHAILQDTDSSVWLGTEGFGLIHLKLNENTTKGLSVAYLKQYAFTGNENGPGNDIIYSLTSEGNDKLWIGCRYGGLSLFDKNTQKFKTFKAFAYPNSLSNNDVLSLYRDKKQRLWIGTSYGLNWLDVADLKTENPHFGEMNRENGLPNNTVHGITEDSKGDIWISTNKGLVRINPSTLKNVNFKKAEELQSNEFSDNAVWKNNEGYMFFGGIYGFNYFMPENIQFDNEQPKLLLSNIKLAGNEKGSSGLQVLNASNHSPISFSLNRNDNYFELNIIPVKFSNQEKWHYSYMLEGNDNSWNNLGEERRISYSNIPAGNYTLKVKWSNGEGVWSDEIQALKIEVKQYFWLTYPAFFIYSLLILTLAYFWHRYRRNKLIMEHKLSVEHLMRNKDEEVHQEQLNFFTNIAHELQSPLTLVSGALERYIYKNRQDGKELFHHKFLSIVNQQTARLNYLVYQLLEFRKAEAGYLKNNYSRVNISNLLFNISELFMPISDQRSLDYDLYIDPDIIIWTDKDKFEKIIFNLLSNAFKHTENSERIIVSLTIDTTLNNIKIVIANSGHELSQLEIDKLFGKFMVLDDTQQTKISSGIGLAFSKELALLLHGNISVTNKDRWISFIVELPLSFTPPDERILKSVEKIDTPSFLLESMTANLEETGSNETIENNKHALMESMDDENKKSILIIEDDTSIRFLLNDILKDIYVVYQANNGKEALDLLGRIIPSLIISDIMMPDMNGLEVCSIVKETPSTCHIPFIILSARGSMDNKTEGYEAGADAYIPKPFHTEHLLVRIKKLIEYQQKMHNLFKQDRIVDRLPETGMKEDDKNFLKATISLIESNMDNQELDSHFLETALSLSRASFFRKLKALSGMTPGELIKSIRLQRIAYLLDTSTLTVSEIFYQSGFNNQSHFFREFKKQFGYSPNEYREQRNIQINTKSKQ
jgi:signal transduction histidine kinase/DNA-binding response OmpR family regulator/ligand-binding sensor domain-containing protein